MSHARGAIWRAVCDAVAAELEAHPEWHRLTTTLDRQVAMLRIAEATIAKLEAQPRRVWTGTLDGPCWVCGRHYAEHASPAGTLDLACLTSIGPSICSRCLAPVAYHEPPGHACPHPGRTLMRALDHGGDW